MSAIIKTLDLTHVYSEKTPFEKTAVNKVNIEIEEGEFVGVIGHTGSGKSTFIQHLNGLMKPTSGKVFINGNDIWESKERLRAVRFEVGLVFQYPEYQLFEETVYKDVAFGPANMGLNEAEIKNSVLQAVDFVGLDRRLLEKSPFELSGGQKRRAAIAGVIAMRPKVLILDEPTAGLDPKGREMILSQIKNYHKATKSTILLVSHSMEDVARFADKILVMNNGGIYKYDTVEKVFNDSQKLEQMGLGVPQITKVFNELSKKGLTPDKSVLTVEDAKRMIVSLLKKGGAE